LSHRASISSVAYVALAAALAPAVARAGAWTEPQGQGQVIETLFGWYGEGAPWGGQAAPRENKLETQTYLEYGLWDRLTLVGEVSALRYALSPPSQDRFLGLDYSGGGLRARLWANQDWVASLEATGYLSSAGDRSRPAQDGDTGPAADFRGQVGRNLSLFGLTGFLDAEAGYRLRTEGPPSEWRADLTLGIDWTPRVKLMFQAFNTISNGAGAPGFSAWESHTGQVSLVYELDKLWSVQAGGFGTLYQRNTNSQYGALVAIWRRF
jgi:hypothetical protein